MASKQWKFANNYKSLLETSNLKKNFNISELWYGMV